MPALQISGLVWLYKQYHAVFVALNTSHCALSDSVNLADLGAETA